MAAAVSASKKTHTPTSSFPSIDTASLGGGTNSSYDDEIRKSKEHAELTVPVNSRRKLKKELSVTTRVSRWLVANQLNLSIGIITATLLVHQFVPSLRWETEKCFKLSYYNPRTGRYGAGWDDMFFVLSWTVIFTGIRAAFMDYIAAPYARMCNMKSKKDQVRFAEQAWMFAAYVPSWSLGLYIMYNSDYWFNMREMWTNWPDRETDRLMKWYYLVEFGFWLQQIVVLNIEEHRKDHWQMLTHHIVTCSLLFGSYAYHQTRIGNVILCLMDTVDYVLSLAKLLRYLGHQFACDCTFGVFIVTWFITRQIFYPMVCYSVYRDVGTVCEFGCYSGNHDHLEGPFDPPAGFSYLLEPFRNPNGLICATQAMANSFLALLLTLQVILLLWFITIVRLAYRVLSGSSADDPRSDEEDEEEEEEELVEKISTSRDGSSDALLEEEVGVEQLHLQSRPVVHSRINGRSTGMQLPVKKELLNRVGCDTKTTK